jgi:hypothetical protein
MVVNRSDTCQRVDAGSSLIQAVFRSTHMKARWWCWAEYKCPAAFTKNVQDAITDDSPAPIRGPEFKIQLRPRVASSVSPVGSSTASRDRARLFCHIDAYSRAMKRTLYGTQFVRTRNCNTVCAGQDPDTSWQLHLPSQQSHDRRQ